MAGGTPDAPSPHKPDGDEFSTPCVVSQAAR
jgi:hypothetical protein